MMGDIKTDYLSGPDLYPRVPALTRVPVPRKAKEEEAPMEKLLKVLERINAQSKAKLLNHGRNANAPEDLRKKDLKRCRIVNAEMRHFEMRRARGLLWTRVITTYCRRMSKFVTEKSNL